MASNIKGITVEIGGNTGPLEKALQGVNKTTRNLQSELSQVNRALKFDPSNTTLLAQKQKLLSESIETTKQKLDSLKAVQSQVQAQFANGKIGEDKYRAFQREIETTQNKLSGLEKQLKTSSSELQAFGVKAAEAGEKLNKIGSGVSSAGKSVTMGVTVPLVGAAAAAVKVGNDFETSMSQAAGALNKPMSQMTSLRELALKTGQDTQFSATEAGNAITELAKGGLTEAQIKGGALKATMDLAASSGMELGVAANTVVQSMGAFGLSADQASQAVNALAGAAAASSTDVQPLSEGLAQCAAQANLVGWSIQDTTAVLGAFADAGVVGSDAGTSLKTMLQRLGAPTDDAATAMESLGINVWGGSGHMKDASGIAQELQSKMSGLSDAQKQAAMNTIFGSDATRAASILMNEGASGLQKYTKATNDQTAASRLAKSQMGETSKSIEQMLGALETAAIKIQEALAPVITSIANKIGNLATAFSNLSPTAQKIILVIAGVAAAIGPLLLIIGGLVTTIGTIAGAIGVVTVGAAAATPAIAGLALVIRGVGAAFLFLKGPVGIAIALIASIGLAIYKSVTNWDTLKTTVSKFVANLPALVSKAGATISKFVSTLVTAITTNLPQIMATGSQILNTIITSITTNLPQIMAVGSQIITNIITAIMTYLPRVINVGLQILTTLITGILNNISQMITIGVEIITKIVESIVNNLPQIINAATQIITTLITGITGVLPNLIGAGLAIIVALASAIIQNLPQIISSALQIIMALVNGITQNLPQIIAAAVKIIIMLAQALIQNLPQIISAAIQIIVAIVKGLAQALPQIIAYMPTIVRAIWNALKEVDWIGLGGDIIRGILAGIKAAAHSLWETMKEIAREALEAAKEVLGIHSPSTKFRDIIGKQIPAGVAMGIENNMGIILTAIDNMVRGISNRASIVKDDTWGFDMMQNIIDGIEKNSGGVVDTVEGVANTIRSYLHFTVPDVGPLSDADTYGSDFMQLLADTMTQNADKPEEAAKKVADLVSAKIKSIKDILASDTKNLNDQLYNLGQQEDVSLRGVKGASRYSIQDEYEAKKKAIKDEIALRKDQANKEIEQIEKIGKMSKEQIQDELDAKKQAVSDIDKLNDVLEKVIERKLNAEKEAAIESANLKAKEEKLTKDQLSNLLEYVNSYYEQKLDKDAIAAQAEQLITSKSQDTIINLLNQYGNLYEDSGLTLGQRLTTGVKSWTDLVPGIVGNAMQNVQAEVQTAAVNVQSTLSNIMQNITTVGAAGAQLAGVDTSFDDIFSKWKDSGMGSTNEEEDPVQKIEDKYKKAFSDIELAMVKLGKDTYSTTEELKKQQDTIDEQTKKLDLMKQEYDEVVTAVGDTSDEAVQLEKDIASLNIEIENNTKKLQQDTITNKYQKSIDNIDKAISKLDVDTSSLSDELDKQNNIYDENMKKLELMKEEYNELVKVFGKNSDAALELESSIDDLTSTITGNVTDARQNISDGIDDFTAKVKDALKEMYTQQQQDFEDSINAQLEDLDTWKDASEQTINDVYDARIKALEAQTEAEDRAATNAEELKNIGSLQESIEYEHNEYNKEQLQKQLDTAITDRNKRLHEQEIEDQKAALEVEKQNQLDNLTQLYNAKKQDLEKQLQDIKDFYTKKLNATNLEAEAEKRVMENSQEELVEILKSYSPDYENAGKTLGEKLFEGFRSKIEGIVDMISSITSQINTARDEAIQAASDAIVSDYASVTAPTYPGAPRQVSDSQTQTIVNNNVNITSPTAQTPSQQRTTMETTLQRLAYQMS